MHMKIAIKSLSIPAYKFYMKAALMSRYLLYDIHSKTNWRDRGARMFSTKNSSGRHYIWLYADGYRLVLVVSCEIVHVQSDTAPELKRTFWLQVERHEARKPPIEQ